MEAEAQNLLQAPAKARGGQGRHREGRIGAPFPGLQLLRKAAARAVPEGITGNQRSHPLSAQRQQGHQRKRDGPRGFGGMVHHRQVARTAEDDFGLFQRITACLGQILQAIFPNADDR